MLGYGLSHGSRENQFIWFTALDPSIWPYLASSMLRAMTLSERIYRKIKRAFEKQKENERNKKKKTNLIQVQTWIEHTYTHIPVYLTHFIYTWTGRGMAISIYPWDWVSRL